MLLLSLLVSEFACRQNGVHIFFSCNDSKGFQLLRHNAIQNNDVIFSGEIGINMFGSKEKCD